MFSQPYPGMCLLDGSISNWQSRQTTTLVKWILSWCHTSVKDILLIYTLPMTSLPLLQNSLLPDESPSNFY